MAEMVDGVLVDAGTNKTNVILAIRDITGDEPAVELMDLRELNPA